MMLVPLPAHTHPRPQGRQPPEAQLAVAPPLRHLRPLSFRARVQVRDVTAPAECGARHSSGRGFQHHENPLGLRCVRMGEDTLKIAPVKVTRRRSGQLRPRPGRHRGHSPPGMGLYSYVYANLGLGESVEQGRQHRDTSLGRLPSRLRMPSLPGCRPRWQRVHFVSVHHVRRATRICPTTTQPLSVTAVGAGDSRTVISNCSQSSPPASLHQTTMAAGALSCFPD
ncbi:hypothetical protein B0T11DRAFT_65630 [Plectosphaerella cucumerina]|uniref:Uncharacterized protein n=1 Tax=Plectosphaerella cucumerina TaxID=40658 RepID=A0A8K0X661_9PEZI|nr:hypothetical protein B0T11DRAFT_65630 [Plectosphaerella cucumerina]